MKLKVSCRSSRILLALKLSFFGGGRNAGCTLCTVGVVVEEEVAVADGADGAEGALENSAVVAEETGSALENGAVVADGTAGPAVGPAVVSTRSSSSE